MPQAYSVTNSASFSGSPPSSGSSFPSPWVSSHSMTGSARSSYHSFTLSKSHFCCRPRIRLSLNFMNRNNPCVSKMIVRGPSSHSYFCPIDYWDCHHPITCYHPEGSLGYLLPSFFSLSFKIQMICNWSIFWQTKVLLKIKFFANMWLKN